VCERVGSSRENSDRSKKYAKALRIAHWMLRMAISKVPPGTNRKSLLNMNTVAVVTDVMRVTYYHLSPVLDEGYSFAIAERGQEVPTSYNVFYRLFGVTRTVLAYKVLHFS
jgi:hypothetical protein